MHQGIKKYLDGNFFLAPLDDPQTILDIGYALHNYLHLASLMSLLIKGPAQGYGKFSSSLALCSNMQASCRLDAIGRSMLLRNSPMLK